MRKKDGRTGRCIKMAKNIRLYEALLLKLIQAEIILASSFFAHLKLMLCFQKHIAPFFTSFLDVPTWKIWLLYECVTAENIATLIVTDSLYYVYNIYRVIFYICPAWIWYYLKNQWTKLSEILSCDVWGLIRICIKISLKSVQN